MGNSLRSKVEKLLKARAKKEDVLKELPQTAQLCMAYIVDTLSVPYGKTHVYTNSKVNQILLQGYIYEKFKAKKSLETIRDNVAILYKAGMLLPMDKANGVYRVLPSLLKKVKP